MHRRLIFAVALLVVLLAVFLAYRTCITWSPVEPLSFRVVRDLGTTVPDAKWGSLRLYEVEVKNSSAADIEIVGGPYLVSRGAGKVRMTIYGTVESLPTPRQKWVVGAGMVPARSTQLCTAHIRAGNQTAFLTDTGTMVELRWISRTKLKVMSLVGHARDLCKKFDLERLGSRIGKPSLEVARCPLDAPVSTLPAASAPASGR
ncbi:hypothetical protein DES53_115108 [Roseimicrobium gellanilyticum]|uniref:Uncharacterized protein n=1 Tax=Roseimicrobium gellanilyticum TaxID=748857 RepID=A0A366H6D5_9BACT|nr:hypothetical protein [Roseimicrobium gellanilyticum]RBP36967.1 hypothetical protein DES53_115108 [Roseimicrobium gellanilyticum]